MTKQEIKTLLENIKKELEETASDYALDFVSDYEADSSSYLSDAFNEWADNSVSVYYSDQFKYYEEHATECENALLELYDSESIADKIKKDGLYSLCCLAGVCGQYNEIMGELWKDEETIKKLLVVRYLLKYDIFDLTADQVAEMLEEVEAENINSINDLKFIIDNYTEKEGE